MNKRELAAVSLLDSVLDWLCILTSVVGSGFVGLEAIKRTVAEARLHIILNAGDKLNREQGQ